MSDTQTPEMDAAELYYDGPTGFVPIKKARKMERERNKLVFDWHKACREHLILMREIEGHRERATKLREALINAVNASCSCGGKGRDLGCCQACEVWHRFVQNIEGKR